MALEDAVELVLTLGALSLMLVVATGIAVELAWKLERPQLRLAGPVAGLLVRYHLAQRLNALRESSPGDILRRARQAAGDHPGAQILQLSLDEGGDFDG